MLGSCFMDFFVGMIGQEVHAFSHEELDVCDPEKLVMKFAEIRPEIVINCTAYTAVDDAEKNREAAFKVNAEAVGNLAKLCRKFDAVLIHFSTDYVFDGKAAEGYKEDDATGPINVYGESKLAGEKLIAENMEKYYLIRTSWLFGKNGKNFVDTMIELGQNALQNGTQLKVVSDQIGSPTYTHDLVKAVIANFIEKKSPFGIYHLTNSGTCSWYDFAKKIFEIRGMNVGVLPVTTDKFPRPARRPMRSVLINNKLNEGLKNWQEGLKSYLNL